MVGSTPIELKTWDDILTRIVRMPDKHPILYSYNKKHGTEKSNNGFPIPFQA